MHPDILQIPTPPRPEQEPRFPTLEEIRQKIRKLALGQEVPESEESRGDEKGVYLYKVVTRDVKGDESLYSYKRAGSYPEMSTAATSIEVSYCKGPYNDGKGICSGGENLSSYDIRTGTWRDVPLNATIARRIADQPLAELSLPKNMDVLFKEESAKAASENAAKGKATAVVINGIESNPDPERVKKHFESLMNRALIRSVYILFDLAQRKGARNEEILEMIYTSMIVLNKPDPQANPLELWNPKGDLAEPQFNAFRVQMNSLSAAIGVTVTRESIRRRQQEIDRDTPVSERIEKLRALFETTEVLLGTTDITVLERREGQDMEGALEKRVLAKPFADRTTTELVKLNKSSSLKDWNKDGNLTEEQFNALTRRRKILMNAVGSLVPNEGKIRHDLNKI